MATPDFSPKLEEKSDEDVCPISVALVDDTSLINNGENIINEGTMNDNSCSKPEQNAGNEDTMNGNSSESNVRSDDEVIKQSPSKCEGNHSTSEDDVAVGKVVARALSFVDGRDEEVQPSRKVQLFSCNQQPGNEGGFLKMVVDGDNGLKVTTTGVQHDPHTLWITHYTVDGQLRQVVIFENERCSQITKKICVLYTQQVKGSQDYILTGKKIKAIPERLNEIEPSLGFLKHPKAIGSELLYLKSLFSTTERKLLVGFDGAGEPIPLNKKRMATADFSPKLEEKNDEDVRPISEAIDDSSLINNGQNIINEGNTMDKPLSNPDMNAYNDDTMNTNSSEGNNVIIKHSPTKCEGNVKSNSVPSNDTNSKGEGNLRSINEPSKDAVSSKDERNTLSDGEENGRSNSVVNVKSEDEESKGMSDETDGNIIAKVFWEDPDEEIIKSLKVQLYNLNQQPGNEGGFLKMVLDGDTGLKVTTTGIQQDPYTFWLTHYTLDEERRQLVVFENVRCSKMTNKKCVLYTQKAAGSDDYVLTGKTIDEIPERLGDIDPFTGFLKRRKAIGSEFLFLKSMLTSKETPLLVGFDGAGQPIPLNKVRKYSSDFQAFFRILEAG